MTITSREEFIAALAEFTNKDPREHTPRERSAYTHGLAAGLGIEGKLGDVIDPLSLDDTEIFAYFAGKRDAKDGGGHRQVHHNNGASQEKKPFKLSQEAMRKLGKHGDSSEDRNLDIGGPPKSFKLTDDAKFRLALSRRNSRPGMEMDF